jgi:hypothetical protein
MHSSLRQGKVSRTRGGAQNSRYPQAVGCSVENDAFTRTLDHIRFNLPGPAFRSPSVYRSTDSRSFLLVGTATMQPTTENPVFCYVHCGSEGLKVPTSSLQGPQLTHYLIPSPDMGQDKSCLPMYRD